MEVQDLSNAIEEILTEEMFDTGIRMNFRDDLLSDISIASISMGFSYRYQLEEEDMPYDIFAYASLRDSNICKSGVGCQIMECGNLLDLADERFFDEIEMTAYIWCESGNFKYDYIWFSVNDINEVMAHKILQHIENFEYDKENRVYIKHFIRTNSL